ncbi:hypothetical protein ACFX10_017925 [Malus domestica]
MVSGVSDQRERIAEVQDVAKSKPKLKDLQASMETMEERLEKVERTILEFDTRLDEDVVDKEEIQTMVDNGKDELRGLVEGLRDELLGALNTMADKMRREVQVHLDNIEARFVALQEEIKDTRELKGDVAFCKEAVVKQFVQGSREIKALDSKVIDSFKPKSYNGKREAKELDTFVWNVERYFKYLKLEDDESKISTATMFLADNALMWWRRRSMEIEQGTFSLTTWDEFKKDLMLHFYPQNAKYEAKEKLRWLKQTGSVKDYVNAFVSLLFEVPNMLEEDKLMYFMSGLQNWAKLELQRRHVQTLSDAIAAAESLIEFKSSHQGDSKSTGKRGNHERSGGEHKPKDKAETSKPKENVVADALSRRVELMATVLKPQSHLLGRVREGLSHDVQAKNIVEFVKDGKTRRFWLEDSLLYTKGKRIYVPKWGSLRKEILKECHDSMWAGHPGTHRTLALVSDAYYWPQMRDDVDSYVKTCLVCQQDKVEQKQPGGLLEPLPTPSRPWECLTMDFITHLPKSDGCGSIFVVVDRFTKYATFIPAPVECTAEVAARLFLKHVVKYWGVPRSIVSDRDARFTGRFWKELFKLLGSKLDFSTAFHPQTDGQTERVNALLETYLRHYVSANQRDWAKLLDVAQFSYNLQRSESTGKSPFELAIGQQPLTPNTVVTGYTGNSPAAFKTAKEWQLAHELARAHLEKASKKMKKWADRKRRNVEFQTGDQVFVKLNASQHKSTRGLHKSLLRKYEGPFPIIKKVGKAAYVVELPPRLKFHPVFHVSNLKPYRADNEEPSRGESHRAPPLMTEAFDKEVDSIEAKRVVVRPRQPKHVEYFVKWKGLPYSEATWEKETSLWQYKDLIQTFERQESTRTSTA